MAANLDQTHSVKSAIGTWDREVKVRLFGWLFLIGGKGADIPSTAKARAPQNHLVPKILWSDFLQDLFCLT